MTDRTYPIQHRTEKSCNIDSAREAATANYASDHLDIHDDAPVHLAEGGYWVQAYVWISEEDMDDYQAHEGAA